MRKTCKLLNIFVLSLFFFQSVLMVFAQNLQNQIPVYIKKERTSGIFFKLNNEREELRNDESRYFEKGNNYGMKFQYSDKVWVYLPETQQYRGFSADFGFVGGNGSVLDSSKQSEIKADQVYAGVGTRLSGDYASRFYYSNKHYTLVQTSGYTNFNWYKQNQSGTQIQPQKAETPFQSNGYDAKFRAGLLAAAAWGYGRMNPVNHYFTARYILEKYYPGRIFSDDEVWKTASKIGEIKHKRNPRLSHERNNETDELTEFLRTELMLKSPGNVLPDWQYSEFSPRLSGQIVEFGPHFSWFNREPDFIYGGFLKIENSSFRSMKKNRNLSAEVRYNRYKKRDWVTLETILGWSLFRDLKSQFDFGIKYMPGIEVNDFKDIKPVIHNFIPYAGYYLQINQKQRLNLNVSYRIVQSDRFMLPGPEFKIGYYSAKY